MKYIYGLLLVVFSGMASASFELGVGTSGALTKVAQGSAMSMTYVHEDGNYFEFDKLPWVVGASLHSDYEQKDEFMDNHFKVSVSKRVYQHNFNVDWSFFLDLGGAWTNKISAANSSYFMFYENIGIKYQRVSLTLNHTSNAMLVKPNYGENSLIVSYEF